MDYNSSQIVELVKSVLENNYIIITGVETLVSIVCLANNGVDQCIEGSTTVHDGTNTNVINGVIFILLLSVGVGFGVLLLVLVVVIITIGVFCKHKKRKRNQ